MSWPDWLMRESLRRRLTLLGVLLSNLNAEFEAVQSVSSQTVSKRIEDAASDYWLAVEALGENRLVDAEQAAKAAFLEVEFVRSLIRAETAERELGECNLFELSHPLNEKQASLQIQSNLKQITVELSNLLEAVRGSLTKKE